MVSVASAQLVSVTVPFSMPTSAIALDRSLVALSIEQDRWTDWAGITEPNTFFLNALENLAIRTGQVPWIRIGADSADHTYFNLDIQFAESIFPDPTESVPYPEASNITVGPGYYALASHLPKGAHVIWGVNFGSNNITAAILEAQAIKSAFNSDSIKRKGIILEAIEIGNEPDIYGFTGRRDAASWTIGEYVKEWTAFANNVSAADESGTKFLGLSFNLLESSGGPFSVADAFSSGILDSPGGYLINEISQHRYSNNIGNTSFATIPSLMSKATIRANLSLLASDIDLVRSKGLGYILGETNNYFRHGEPGVSNTAAAAIWMIDYILYAASIGIKRAHFHEGIGFRYNLIQPATLDRSILDGSPLPGPLLPHVQPMYYGALVATEAVGSNGFSHIIELDIADDVLTGFAIFEEETLRKVVIVNSQPFLSTDKANDRRLKNVALSIKGRTRTLTSAEVKRLRIEHADDTCGLLWAGQSFETKDARPTGAVLMETLAFVNGSLVVSLTESEAVLLFVR